MEHSDKKTQSFRLPVPRHTLNCQTVKASPLKDPQCTTSTVSSSVNLHKGSVDPQTYCWVCSCPLSGFLSSVDILADNSVGKHTLRTAFWLNKTNYTMENDRYKLSGTTASPWNAKAAGPVMYTFPSDSLHSINKSPPGKVTVHCRSASPLSTAATTRAQAPVPQACVIPQPLSHTTILRCSRLITCVGRRYKERVGERCPCIKKNAED